MSKETSSTTTKSYFVYSTIPLRIFVDISRSGNLELLGKGTPEELKQAWEEIMKRNGKATGDHSYTIFLMNIKSFCAMMFEFIDIRSKIIKLHYVIDQDMIKALRRKGYNINTSAGQVAYNESLNNALSRSENIITRIQIKLKEMEKDNKKAESVGEDEFGFEEIVAQLNVNLGFNVDDTLTLARFNEYKKIIHKRNSNNRRKYGNRE